MTMQTLNQDLEEANQQYEKLDSVKTDFVTVASHELRTPLAQIRGYTDILDALNEQGMLDQSQVEAMVDNLRRAAERTEELLEAMLDVSQLDVNAMDLRFAEAAPENVIRMAIEPLTEHIRRRRLTLSARGLRNLPAIYCDSQRLVQAFRNIVTNAIKFTPDGGRVRLVGRPEDGGVRVEVTDTGIGIAPEEQSALFREFVQLDASASRRYEGTGLGLALCKRLVELHGGHIGVVSEHGRGSTFWFTLPRQPPSPVAGAA
jgi:signal transduction histidine kinase